MISSEIAYYIILCIKSLDTYRNILISATINNKREIIINYDYRTTIENYIESLYERLTITLESGDINKFINNIINHIKKFIILYEYYDQYEISEEYLNILCELRINLQKLILEHRLEKIVIIKQSIISSLESLYYINNTDVDKPFISKLDEILRDNAKINEIEAQLIKNKIQNIKSIKEQKQLEKISQIEEARNELKYYINRYGKTVNIINLCGNISITKFDIAMALKKYIKIYDFNKYKIKHIVPVAGVNLSSLPSTELMMMDYNDLPLFMRNNEIKSFYIIRLHLQFKEILLSNLCEYTLNSIGDT